MIDGRLFSDELRRALHGEAWHGPSVLELLADVDAVEALQRPIPTAHNIWELTLHIASWANIALRRINGGQAEPFMGEDWPLVLDHSAEAWEASRLSVSESYERLSEIVVGLSDETLSLSAPQSERSVGAMVNGVAQHAAYHGGQIALLKKLVTTHHRRTAL